ncbi:MAG TPA: ribonuclease P [Candidatus Nanoarchaeia archaeon]|nr:ribonuclease P [Candidatus Nanoarchaeia archaeon]
MRKNKHKLREEALSAIYDLFAKARADHEHANDFVRKARRLVMKVNLPLPRDFKRKFCKHCYNYFMHGNYRVRTRNKVLVYYCLRCKKFSRFPFKNK